MGRVRKIKLFPDPILLRATKEIGEIDEEIRNLISDMKETVEHYDALGLAGNQVGSEKRLFVLRLKETAGEKFIVVLNPRIIKEEGIREREEGCLSLPGISEVIKRPARIIIEGMDENGEKKEFEFNGLLARACKHEIDHLDGKLLIDYLSKVRRQFIEKKLEEIKQKTK